MLYMSAYVTDFFGRLVDFEGDLAVAVVLALTFGTDLSLGGADLFSSVFLRLFRAATFFLLTTAVLVDGSLVFFDFVVLLSVAVFAFRLVSCVTIFASLLAFFSALRAIFSARFAFFVAFFNSFSAAFFSFVVMVKLLYEEKIQVDFRLRLLIF